MGEQAFLKLKQEKYHETTAPERSSYGINSQTSSAWLCRQKANHSKSEHPPPPPPPHAQVLSSLISESHNWKQHLPAIEESILARPDDQSPGPRHSKAAKGLKKSRDQRRFKQKDSVVRLDPSEWKVTAYIYIHIHIYTHIKP